MLPLVEDLYNIARHHLHLEPSSLLRFTKCSTNPERIVTQSKSTRSSKNHHPSQFTSTSNPSRASQSRIRKKRRRDLPNTKSQIEDVGSPECKQNTYKIYIRVLAFSTTDVLKSKLRKYALLFPGDDVFTQTCLRCIEGMGEYLGQASMAYGGATIRDPIKRSEEDETSVWRRWSNWMSKSHQTQSSRLHTHSLTEIDRGHDGAYASYEYDTGIAIDRFELRARQDLQDLERSLITCLGQSLNSARGGLTPILLPHPLAPKRPSLILSRQTEAWPYTAYIDQCFKDARQFIQDLPSSIRGNCISDHGFLSVIRHAQRGSTYCGTLPTMLFGNEITIESLTAHQDDFGFSDRLTGAGPRITDQARINALGLDHQSPLENEALALNTFIDFWSISLWSAPWIPLLQSSRLILHLRPVLLRPFSSRLSQLLLDGSFHTCFASEYSKEDRRVLTEFLAGKSPRDWKLLEKLLSPAGQSFEWDGVQSHRWRETVGDFYLVQIKDLWVLILPDFDGGIVKYDPVMGDVIEEMKKVIALKGVVAEEVIMRMVDDKGKVERDLESMADLKSRILLACEDRGLTAALTELKTRYQQLQLAVLSSRHEAKWRRMLEAEMELGIQQEVRLIHVGEDITDSYRRKTHGANTREGYCSILEPVTGLPQDCRTRKHGSSNSKTHC